IPFSGLGVDNKTLDEQGRLKTLQQAGWEVEYLRYVPFENTTMPGKIFITHPGLNVRLIISDWRHVE
ncbi:MAG TPA: outer membrane lipoprotein LolB, partial [Methylophaga aminisulfidivorans]|nr:outer membrane lipoprotein LolB [Methylophaga aminisulfidivorans]